MTQWKIWYVCPRCDNKVSMAYHSGVPLCRKCLGKDGEFVPLEKKEMEKHEDHD